MNKQYSSIGSLIADLMAEKNMSAYELADLSGVKAATIYAIVKGGTDSPTRYVLDKILNVLAPDKGVFYTIGEKNND